MFSWMINKIKTHDSDNGLPNEYLHYAAHAYPSNHTFKITSTKLIPSRQLIRRYKKIRRLFPDSFSSIVDIGSSKGFFVFDATTFPTCTRGLGIDINEYDIHFCRQLKNYLNNPRVNFELLQLKELTEKIDKFGGAFQTALVINLYQYLYFGSDRFQGCYLNHDAIFKYLRMICNGRVIFNNRMKLEEVQNERWVKEAGDKINEYTEEKIKAAASVYFEVKEHGYIGRYPLLTLDAR